MPSTSDRLRKAFVRQVEDAVRRANADENLEPLNEVLRVVRKWVDRPLRKGTDPRIAWSFWMDGVFADGSPARMKPLPTLLDAYGLPDEALAELLNLTERIADLPHVQPMAGTASIPGGPRLIPTSYTALTPSLVLSLAHLPGMVAIVHEQDLMTSWRRAGPAGMSDSQVWSQALASGVLAENTGTNARAMARRYRAFTAALNHGWLPPDVLDTWVAPRVVLTPQPGPIMRRMVLTPPSSDAPGSLVDFLALTETPGGLLEHWRAAHPTDWSTRVSPASGTTVWAGLLHNPNPALLTACLAEDPTALDRPVPIGRWHHVDFHDPKSPLGFRSVAGRTSSRGDLEVARRRTDPATFRRINAWWETPAPTLRQTLNVWWYDLLPLNDQPPQHRDAWHALVLQVERWDLERSASTPSGLLDPPVPGARRPRL